MVDGVKEPTNIPTMPSLIVGKQTGKILHLGVRNKFCWTCTQTQNIVESPSTHTCFKNWDGSSSSMETDIILHGFKTAEHTKQDI